MSDLIVDQVQELVDKRCIISRQMPLKQTKTIHS
jgi:hypothetical protein